MVVRVSRAEPGRRLLPRSTLSAPRFTAVSVRVTLVFHQRRWTLTGRKWVTSP